MPSTILIGSLLITLTIFVTVLFMELAQSALGRWGNHILGPASFSRKTILLVMVMLWMLGGLSIAIWIWAAGFFALDAFSTFEEALYFSMVSFTTLGFGDVILPNKWRLLSGIIATNGLLIVGLTTALLIDVMSRMRDGDMSTYLSERKK